MNRHLPVLLDKVLQTLDPQVDTNFVDLTAGFGGHSAALLERVGPHGHGYLYDRDPMAITALHQRFVDTKNITIKKANFGELDWRVDIHSATAILADLGVSSPQIDTDTRGFSFMSDGPLDMRMDNTQELTASQIVNTYTEQSLADILYQYGEERQSRKLARAITQARNVRPIQTTAELAQLIADTIPRVGKIHPATRSFQALRIATNDELGNLKILLENIPIMLVPGAKLAIISFHSLEDRLVKQAFKSLCTVEKNDFGHPVSEPEYRLVTKKPIKGSEFDKTNPRARSAKLRVVEKINKNKKEG